MMPTEIQPGHYYRHQRRRSVYQILLVAERVEEEGGGQVVVYRNVALGVTYCQTVERFLAPGRFERVEVRE